MVAYKIQNSVMIYGYNDMLSLGIDYHGIDLIKAKFSYNISGGSIFSCVRPFYEKAL